MTWRRNAFRRGYLSAGGEYTTWPRTPSYLAFESLMIAVAKVLLCMTPLVFSIVATDTARAELAERPNTQATPVPAIATRPVHAEPCQQGGCLLRPDTVKRVVRVSYVPEIISAADDL